MDKKQIAKAFGKKATLYDTHARVQKYVGDRLLSLLKEQQVSVPGPLLDLGTGSGYFLPALKQFQGGDALYAADLSEGMIRFVNEHYQNVLSSSFVADAEQLPLADNSLSYIFSSMAIQWCEDYKRLFKELVRVVKPGGFVAFSTLLPNTLFELKDAWHEVDERNHVNRFLDSDSIIHAMSVHAEIQSAHAERVVAGYPDLKSLLHSIKGIGANTVVEGSGAMTKGQYVKLVRAYESFRDSSGMLPASYDVFYGVMQVPQE
ncbi:malonyl-ACP O-methyltransferase BioC [Litoribrevibacter albus]|uniref:Malonyl-[acyl-carrier protein] O-methyltransferase n=1 Tax=Litoribrevibacter albus TaxID=1473156 RepID=A0AA37SF95_9GAMM|nr:malonyl-ACP O-methyltransferase BioC [Litoribrevibacter albus]GLQ33276.1 malonyl-[acyl-carrier protein] O-methyltransferase [Litoribrevibacter albus]